MANLVELQARLESLKAQRDSGVAVVSYEGRRVEYRGGADIDRAIAALTREIEALEGTPVVRQIRVYQDGKGL